MPKPETAVTGELRRSPGATCDKLFFVLWLISRSPCLREWSSVLQSS